jgi:hypothetical protein
LDGVISSFHKPGDPSFPAHYRPITLLDTDYRTLARVLAARLIPVLGQVIEREQTAFLHHRRISDNVLLLQFLPEMFRSRWTYTTVVAFLDFYKAYDTLDRPFLMACLEALGVGGGFLAWVQRLLTGTRSAAMVNGRLSAYVPITGGVRQGCPLSPPLYLGPAQALLSWLKAQGVSVRGGLRESISASQFADDTAPFLPSREAVPQFLVGMETFRAASGQKLNLDKCELLPIGQRTPAPAVPASAAPVLDHGLRLVRAATTLGVTFSDFGAEGSWSAVLARVDDSLSRIPRLPLSVFGRAAAASAYGLSRIFYYAEFMGLPPAAALQRLGGAVAALVDRRVTPAAYAAQPRAALTGIPSKCMPVHPREEALVSLM